MKAQKELVQALLRAKLIVTDGGHEIPEEQPGLTIQATGDVVSCWRCRRARSVIIFSLIVSTTGHAAFSTQAN